MNKESAIVLFNRNSAAPWQAYENILVMVTNRKGEGNEFVRAIDVRIGDNVWEHNIVKTTELIAEPVDKIKFHYGAEKEGPKLIDLQKIVKIKY